MTPQGEIDAHEDNFKACAQEGQDLLDDEHPASDEVKEKVSLWEMGFKKCAVDPVNLRWAE